MMDGALFQAIHISIHFLLDKADPRLGCGAMQRHAGDDEVVDVDGEASLALSHMLDDGFTQTSGRRCAAVVVLRHPRRRDAVCSASDNHEILVLSLELRDFGQERTSFGPTCAGSQFCKACDIVVELFRNSSLHAFGHVDFDQQQALSLSGLALHYLGGEAQDDAVFFVLELCLDAGAVGDGEEAARADRESAVRRGIADRGAVDGGVDNGDGSAGGRADVCGRNRWQ